MEYIDEIFLMDDVFQIEESVRQKSGMDILNVSHWDSSVEFQKHMNRVLELPVSSLPWNYYYTYSISMEDRQRVLSRLGITREQIPDTMGLLLQSSTIAIVNMINLLVHRGKKKLCILLPAYFSVSTCCQALGLSCDTEEIRFSSGHPEIPMNQILNGGYDCVWITSPIFCTGRYFTEQQICEIAKLKDAGLTLVFDESLALPGKELLRFFPIDDETFSIYSPHKAISMNGLKFAVLVCSKRYEDFLEQWVDVFSGALASSNRDAVFHYISSNYQDICLPAYKDYIGITKVKIERLLDIFPDVFILNGTEGHYINIFTHLKLEKNSSLPKFLQRVIEESMASFIPGTLNGYGADQGLCFRVNLTASPSELTASVGRILRYLSDHCYTG